MGRRTVLPGHIFGGEAMARRLRDMQLNQDAARPSSHHGAFGKWELGEVLKVADLIKGIFGRSGVVEADQNDAGLLLAGYFLDDDAKTTPVGTERRRTFPFKGRCLADFEQQIRDWNANR